MANMTRAEISQITEALFEAKRIIEAARGRRADLYQVDFETAESENNTEECSAIEAKFDVDNREADAQLSAIDRALEALDTYIDRFA